jgi:hypothetical protein
VAALSIVLCLDYFHNGGGEALATDPVQFDRHQTPVKTPDPQSWYTITQRI